MDSHDDLIVCGEHDRVEGLIEAIDAAKPDALILDILFPDGDGLEVLKTLRQSGNEIPVLIVTSYDEKKLASKAIRHGANGFVMKEEATKRVISGLRSVINGEIFLNKSAQDALLSQVRGSDLTTSPAESAPLDDLTDREREIFECVGAGMSSKQIAKQLKISPSTVDVHKANMRSKLNLSSASELLQKAIQYCSKK